MARYALSRRISVTKVPVHALIDIMGYLLASEIAEEDHVTLNIIVVVCFYESHHTYTFERRRLGALRTLSEEGYRRAPGQKTHHGVCLPVLVAQQEAFAFGIWSPCIVQGADTKR